MIGFSLLKKVALGNVSLSRFIVPLVIVAVIALGSLFMYQKYQNLVLQNELLTLEIDKLKKEIGELKRVNEENVKDKENLKISCDISLEELKNTYELRQIADKKQIDILKRRKSKEEAVDTEKVIGPDGKERLLTEEEKFQKISTLRLDSLFESYTSKLQFESEK